MSSDLGRPDVSGAPASEETEGTGAAVAAAPSTPSTAPSVPSPSTLPAGVAGAALVFDDPLDRPSADDSDGGWGESFAPSADDDFTRFLNEKPPHHI